MLRRCKQLTPTYKTQSGFDFPFEIYTFKTSNKLSTPSYPYMSRKKKAKATTGHENVPFFAIL